MTTTDSYHRPVLADEAVAYLITRRDGIYIDATAGGGNHTRHILTQLESAGQVLAIDRDDDAIEETGKKIQEFSSRVTLIRGDFARLVELAGEAGIASVSGVFFDLGVSSHQLDDAGRGFSYREDGPLDLRMDRRQTMTAADIIRTHSTESLANMLYEYGGERNSRKIAAAIENARRKSAIETTTQLAEIIASVTNPRFINKTLSRTYQALRIEVNEEMEQLHRGLDAAHTLLERGGRLVVITYHSLEDRIVKVFMRERARESSDPRKALVVKKPITPTAEEIRENRRARSAKMRILEKT